MRCLVLNSAMEPFLIIGWQKAITLDFRNKVDVLEYHDKTVKTVNKEYKIPAVIMVHRYINPNRYVEFSRNNVYFRDNYTCQYCNIRYGRHDLTYDHVLPKSRGGKTTWENIVTACKLCNNQKANRTPEEADLVLLNKPKRLEHGQSLLGLMGSQIPDNWKFYLGLK